MIISGKLLLDTIVQFCLLSNAVLVCFFDGRAQQPRNETELKRNRGYRHFGKVLCFGRFSLSCENEIGNTTRGNSTVVSILYGITIHYSHYSKIAN